MLKKIDTGILFDYTNLEECQILYPITFKTNESVRIESGIMKLLISQKPIESNYFIRNIKDEIIEFIDRIQTDGEYLIIDITDEIQNALSNGLGYVFLRLELLLENVEHQYEKSIQFNESDCKVLIEYTPHKVEAMGSAVQETDIKRAGSSKINLFTGKLKLIQSDVAADNDVLPISVSHIYNSLDANRDQDSFYLDHNINLPKYCCGKGWKLNVHQYLGEKNYNIPENDETSKEFTYVDAEGNHQIFEEKYYYVNENKQKIYLRSSVIDIDANQELSYTVKATVNGIVKEIKYIVEREIKSTTGLKLISSPENFKGIKYIDKDIEEISNLKNEIKQYEKAIKELDTSIRFNIKNICMLSLAKNAYAIQNVLQNKSNICTEKQIELDNTVFDAQHALPFVQKSKNYDKIKNCTVEDNFPDLVNNPMGNYQVGFGSGEAYSLEVDDKTWLLQKHIFEKVKEYYKKNGNDESKFIPGFQSGIIKNNQELSKEFSDAAISEKIKKLIECTIGVNKITQDNIDSFVAFLKESGKKQYYVNENRQNVGNWSQSKTAIMQFDFEIEKIFKQNETFIDNKEEYSIQLEKARRQLEQLNTYVPVHYINDNDGIMMGFGVTKTANLYRLVLIADKWNNAVYIRYDDKDRIESIIEADESVISFEYDKDSGNLTKITDANGRNTLYCYDSNGYLNRIIYPDNETSSYSYNSAGLLLSAVETSGYGAKFDYLNNQVTKITEISKNQIITADSVTEVPSGTITIGEDTYCTKDTLDIEYYDCRSTTVKDKYQNRQTYIFDSAGRTVTVYENKFDEEFIGNNATAVTFDYQNNKNTFSISALNQSREYLNGGTFTNDNNGSFYEYPFKRVSENYLGKGFDSNDIICGDTIVPASYSTETADNQYGNIYVLPYLDPFDFNDPVRVLSRYIEQEELAAIKASGKKDFVLSCWAKSTDSLAVNRRNTDYCGKCDTDKVASEIYEEFAAEHQKLRRFELRAELKYSNGRVDEQYASFDWMQTNWQYCAVPVALSENPSDEIIEIKVVFDYSYNLGQAELLGMSLKEGKWEYNEYNEDDLKIYSENSVSEYVTVFEYDEDKNLIKTALMDRENYNLKSGGLDFDDYATVYEYNYASMPVRSIDYNGIVTENVYNDKGVIVRTLTYHKDDPSGKIYREGIIDNYGKTTGSVNEFGEKLCDYEYVKDTGNVSVITDVTGAKTSFGYGLDGNTLLSVSSDADGELNSNIYGYTLGLLTEYASNGINIGCSYDGFGRLKAMEIAKEPYLKKTYENIIGSAYTESGILNQDVIIGEKITTVLGNGAIYESFTDKKSNLYKINYNGRVLLENSFDMFGTLGTVKDYSNSVVEKKVFSYNDYGKVTKVECSGAGADYAVENVYDDKGKQTETRFGITGNIQRVTRFVFNENPDRMLNSLILANGITQNLDYDKLGRIKRINSFKDTPGIGISLSKDIHYMQRGDHVGNLVASEWFGKNGINKENLKYAYDVNGNITSIRENGELIAKYTYDSLSRLIREDNKKLDKTCVFAYDGNGNILFRKEYRFTLAETDMLSDGNKVVYEYPSEGWKDRLLSYNGALIGNYDALGNPGLYRGKELTWSHGRQLDSIGNITYTYNASGIRLSKTVNGKTTKFYTDGTTILAQECQGKTLYFDYGADGINGFTVNGNESYYYKKNIQGDILAVIDANGTEIARYVYDAWGNHKLSVLDGTQYIENPNTEAGIANLAVATQNPFRYRGYYYDIETGLYYLNTRYYDSEIGRFINADDVSNAEPDAINGLNLYAYCYNNPVIMTDENGNKPNWKKIFGWIVTGLVLVGLTVATVLTFGAAAPITGAAASLVIAATVGAYVGFGASIISQGGFAKANPWQVLLDTTVGAGTGALMASGFGVLGTGVGIAILNGTQSVVTDLIAGEKVNIGEAVAIALVTGLISGIGKGIAMKVINDNPMKPGVIMGGLAAGIAKVISKVVKAITAGLRSGAKKLVNFLFD